MKKTKKKNQWNKAFAFLGEKINKIEKWVAKLVKRKQEKTQINKIREEKVEITIDTEYTQRTTGDTLINLYSRKLKNLREIDEFLDIYKINF